MAYDAGWGVWRVGGLVDGRYVLGATVRSMVVGEGGAISSD